MPLEKPIRYLVNHIQSELNDNGWKLKFFKKDCFRNDCHGYFDENSKTIAVEKIKSWPSILAHEFSHYLQFKNKHKTRSLKKIKNITTIRGRKFFYYPGVVISTVC